MSPLAIMFMWYGFWFRPLPVVAKPQPVLTLVKTLPSQLSDQPPA